jgi:hypothetical protein
MIVPPSTSAAVHCELIISLAAQHRLPAVYPSRSLVANGGLISYGPAKAVGRRCGLRISGGPHLRQYFIGDRLSRRDEGEAIPDEGQFDRQAKTGPFSADNGLPKAATLVGRSSGPVLSS